MKSAFALPVAMFIGASCGPGLEEGPVEAAVWRFVPPPAPGLEMYGTAILTFDQHLRPVNRVDRETALRIPAVDVARDEEGRISEAAGLWRGRRSDNVPVAEHPPLLRFFREGGNETVTFHRADGIPFPMQGVYVNSIERDPDSGLSEMGFLEENPVSHPMDTMPNGSSTTTT